MQIKKCLLILITAILVLINIKVTFALDDGAYLIGRSTSYVNPLTGSTEDGGTNITLGESMISSIVENDLLLEQTNGKYYITIGLGLASNITDVRFKLMDSTGSFSSVNATKTGSSSANGDTVNHYRIEVSSLNDYISPIIYVTPMGRDVQFFIKLNQDSITPGTGIYVSKMVPNITNDENVSSSDTTTTSNSDNDINSNQNNEITNEELPQTETPVTTVEKISRESLFDGVSGLSSYVIGENGTIDKKKKLTAKNLLGQKEQKKTSSTVPVIVSLMVIIGGIYFYVKKVNN